MMHDLCIRLQNGICVQMVESSNPPSLPGCIGCIGIYAYNPDGTEAGYGGELEYMPGQYECMEDAVPDVLLFSELPKLPYDVITEDEFYKQCG